MLLFGRNCLLPPRQHRFYQETAAAAVKSATENIVPLIEDKSQEISVSVAPRLKLPRDDFSFPSVATLQKRGELFLVQRGGFWLGELVRGRNLHGIERGRFTFRP